VKVTFEKYFTERPSLGALADLFKDLQALTYQDSGPGETVNVVEFDGHTLTVVTSE
jgi:hypothetical protein